MKRNLFRLNILCPNGVIKKILEKFPTLKVVRRYDTPFEGYLIFHSRKARDWTNKELNKFENGCLNYFMCFASIPEVEQ